MHRSRLGVAGRRDMVRRRQQKRNGRIMFQKRAMLSACVRRACRNSAVVPAGSTRLSRQANHADRAVRRRRPVRHHRPAGGGAPRAAARPADGGGERRRRRRHARRGAGGQGRAGRLYAADASRRRCRRRPRSTPTCVTIPRPRSSRSGSSIPGHGAAQQEGARDQGRQGAVRLAEGARATRRPSDSPASAPTPTSAPRCCSSCSA